MVSKKMNPPTAAVHMVRPAFSQNLSLGMTAIEALAKATRMQKMENISKSTANTTLFRVRLSSIFTHSLGMGRDGIIASTMADKAR
ncbi:hypothetical protein Mapa_001604 [Marchantia paleacea]|nr:hypothetical protein Mapa_001604 [Marchantia paleacea]